jgi:serine/threonine-protein kinase HipA
MPLTPAQHGNAKIDPFLWGLLPDNEKILDQRAQPFQVSARNAFGLIAAVGEDCAGVQFIPPKRLDAVLGETPAKDRVAGRRRDRGRLRSLIADHSA